MTGTKKIRSTRTTTLMPYNMMVLSQVASYTSFGIIASSQPGHAPYEWSSARFVSCRITRSSSTWSPHNFEPDYLKLTREDVRAFMRSFPEVQQVKTVRQDYGYGRRLRAHQGVCALRGAAYGTDIDLKSRGGDHLKAETLEMLPDVQSQIPIGVGKKCCYLCHILASQLELTGRLKFLLPGTHGTVYPWVPPPPPYLDFEIVQHIGQSLHVLFWNYILSLRAKEEEKEIPSRNSSPTSVEDEDVVDYQDELADRKVAAEAAHK
ncbi:hypothetical protein CYLTODRAFT_427165 [Cylindrobasidium torrendii FP15055 ss-10]|uniref:Uncharacterized protein n=1 Tax=Cylindrobasidium torrendii FP15055 ss-10 TaxID=1314674 RepID=A0A0D7AVR2_9AGAR|nr:hypothetical protein CYLTODRAFT_427165 [Cylindrobasidium torrendii FP15055 ss-10]